jgi:hypothetical protein
VLVSSAILCAIALTAFLGTTSLAGSSAALFAVGLTSAPHHPLAMSRAYGELAGHPGTVQAIGQIFVVVDVGAPIALGAVADHFGLGVAVACLLVQPAVIVICAVGQRAQAVEASVGRREREIDLEASPSRVDVREALRRLEGPHLVEPQEDERPFAARDEERGDLVHERRAPRTDTFETSLDPLVGERLEQVVDHLEVEGLDRVLAECGREDERRRVRPPGVRANELGPSPSRALPTSSTSTNARSMGASSAATSSAWRAASALATAPTTSATPEACSTSTR